MSETERAEKELALIELGSRFKMPNGDVVRVIGNQENEYLVILNGATYKIVEWYGDYLGWGFMGKGELHQALEAVGAKIIPEEKP